MDRPDDPDQTRPADPDQTRESDPDATRPDGAAQPTPGAAPATPLTPGVEFAGHRIESLLGSGGMGAVYRARHLMLDRERAVKLINPGLSQDPLFRERFRRETRLAASIDHPHIVDVHHAGDQDGVLYLTMRLVEGRDLSTVLDQEGPLEPERCARLVAQVAAALDAAHAGGLVHRDVKPANVLVEEREEGEHAYLTDFGISRMAGSATTLTSGGFIGTVDYVAPEQIQGEETDGRADQYSLACLTFHLLTGRPPFADRADVAKIMAHVQAERPSVRQARPELPERIDDAIRRAMAVDPAERFPATGAFAAGLAGTGEQAAATPSGPVPGATSRAASSPRSARRAAGVAAGLLVAAAIAAAVLLTGGDDPSGPGDPGPGGSDPVASVASQTEIGRGALEVSIGSLQGWAVNRVDQSLWRLDRRTGEVVGSPIPVEGTPTGVVADFSAIWVIDGSGDRLLRLKPGQDETPLALALSARPGDLATGEGFVWVTGESDGTLVRIPPSGEVATPFQIGGTPTSVAAGNGAVFVGDFSDGSLLRIDPATGEVESRTKVGATPNGIVAARGSVWVIDNRSGDLYRLSRDGSAVESVAEAAVRRPRGLAVSADAVWVVSGARSSIHAFDPRTLEPLGDPVEVGKDPADVAVGAGAVWTADFDDGTITRLELR